MPAVLALAVVSLLVAGFAMPPPEPAPPRPKVRDATPEEHATISHLLVPLLITSGIWTGPADGCAAALGILSGNAINLAVGPNAKCKFSLGITEEALRVLPPDELRAGWRTRSGTSSSGISPRARSGAPRRRRHGMRSMTRARPRGRP